MKKEEALKKLNMLLTELKELPRYNPNTENTDYKKWNRKAKRYIENIFKENDRGQLSEFESISFFSISTILLEKGISAEIADHDKGRKSAITLLESFIEEVDEWEDNDKIHEFLEKEFGTLNKKENNLQKTVIVEKNKVFIVHGHDNEAKQEVARFIEKFGLEAIILHEQASSSKTIIEKIEHYTNQVGFGIVLYTECDVGGKDQDNLKFRARQNVVLEHGYLMAKLGRTNVCPLVKGNVETPSDIDGIVYVSMDGDSWQFTLAKELKASGYNIDLNKLY